LVQEFCPNSVPSYNSAMLTLLLQTAQQAKLVAPNIYVVPAPGGMPEWVKILITAVVGAIFGVMSAPLTELAKTFILRIPARRKIRAQLVEELIENLDRLEQTTSEILELPKSTKPEVLRCLGAAEAAVHELRTDQFDHYFVTEKAIVYEIDPNRNLAEFYKRTKESSGAVADLDLDFVIQSFKVAILVAVRFLRQNKIVHIRKSTLREQMVEIAEMEAEKEETGK
jgi:hypothetical protein